MFGQELAQIVGQVLDDGGDAGIDADLATDPAGVVRQFDLHLLQVTHQHARVMQQRMRCRRQFQPLGTAVEQRRVQPPLQVGNALADGRRGDVLAVRRLGDALLLADRDEQLQRQKIETHVALLPTGIRVLSARLRCGRKPWSWRSGIFVGIKCWPRPTSRITTRAFRMKSSDEPSNRGYGLTPHRFGVQRPFAHSQAGFFERLPPREPRSKQ